MTPEQILGDYKSFIIKILGNMDIAGVNFFDFGFKEIDHLAYRTETVEKYEEMKSKLNQIGEKVSEIEVRGRPIAVYKLNQPLMHGTYKISTIELPAPSPEKNYKEGLEHLEIVVEEDLSEIKSKFPNLGFELKRPESLNPELTLKFEDGSTVKFHNQNLLRVVELEKEAGLTNIS